MIEGFAASSFDSSAQMFPVARSYRLAGISYMM